MAARFALNLQGDKALADALHALPELVERRVVSKAVQAVGKAILLPAIRANTPRGRPGYRTLRRRQRGRAFAVYVRSKRPGGHLAQSLKVRNLRRRRHRIGVGVFAGTKIALGIPNARGFYPAHLEFGYKRFRTGELKTGLHYMKRPLLAVQFLALERLAQEIRQGIEREVRPR